MIQKIIAFLKRLFGIRAVSDSLNTKTFEYERKPFMTASELVFYHKILELEPQYRIVPQVNLATVVRKINKGYISELFRNIDFAIFDQECKNLLLLIELNDSTHNKNSRRRRDLRVRKICDESGIQLITFYTKYPNEKQYVLNRIRDELSKEIAKFDDGGKL